MVQQKNTTESLIFDNDRATKLYGAYQKKRLKKTKEDFVTLCIPLCRVLAARIAPTMVDDLMQESIIKVMEILGCGAYTEEKGTLHAFLTRVIRNKIMDVLMKENRYPNCVDFNVLDQEDLNVNHYPESIESVSVDDLLWYLPQRFYTFPETVTEDMARYLFGTIPTNPYARHARRSKLTMMHYYDIEERQAVLIYNVAEIILRAFSMDVGDPAQAIMLAKEYPDVYYWTYAPELAMFMPREKIPTLSKVFRKVTVRL